jgi:Na+-translocating ferredoxin:NAD+ oxidoreductase subunit B
VDIALQTVIIGGIGLICGAILAVASKYLAVEEDPRIEQLTAILPGINCGACGYAGCSGYAEAMVKEGAAGNRCSPGGTQTAQKIAAFLGIEASALDRHVALVLCGGSNSRARRSSLYNGLADCQAAELVAGGGKSCRYGCMGFGTCSRVCPVNAIEIDDGLAAVHPELCIACGKCVAACPRKLIRLLPESRFIHILCNSPERGPDVKKVCDVGCIGCTICAKLVNSQGIRMNGALAVVNYAEPLDNIEVIAKCPQHTIVQRAGARKEPA